MRWSCWTSKRAPTSPSQDWNSSNTRTHTQVPGISLHALVLRTHTGDAAALASFFYSPLSLDLGWNIKCMATNHCHSTRWPNSALSDFLRACADMKRQYHDNHFASHIFPALITFYDTVVSHCSIITQCSYKTVHKKGSSKTTFLTSKTILCPQRISWCILNLDYRHMPVVTIFVLQW